ncbi:MAG TPA: transglutaminase family protein [Candidatus Methylacidiphilales bacterium]|nr:transglutaminase family protein [Candidatus Methylacidiphilales bacterium]
MLRPILFLILGGGSLLSPGILPAQNAPVPAAQHLQITGSRRLRLTYDCSFVWPRGGGYSAVFYLPIPRDTGTQHIEHFTSSLKGEIQSDDAVPPHRFLTAMLHHDSGDDRYIHWRVEIIGTFQTRRLTDGPPLAGDPIVPPGPGEYLGSTESINWDDARFQAWLDSSGLRRRPGETPVHYGARVYAYFRENGSYTYPPETAWVASAACRHLNTDCGGFSLVFAAACRANKIPARLLVGQWFKTRELSGGSLDLTGRQAHVIAEFFDPQIGWIPEDISSTLLRIPGPPNLDYFGRDPGYFFAWHVDTDFHFDVPRKSDAHVQWIQNPSFWFTDNADEACDTLSHHWTVETLP